jgi:hypothetical protein
MGDVVNLLLLKVGTDRYISIASRAVIRAQRKTRQVVEAKGSAMSTPSVPVFVDVDPQTGRPRSTTYESVRASLLRDLPDVDNLPDDVRRALSAAVDYFALAYEQANVGRMHLYASLTDDAYLKAVLALELMLRHRLRRGKHATLHGLVREGVETGLLPGGKEHAPIWDGVREGRNQITHGDPAHPSYGPLASGVIRGLFRALGEMGTSGGQTTAAS